MIVGSLTSQSSGISPTTTTWRGSSSAPLSRLDRFRVAGYSAFESLRFRPATHRMGKGSRNGGVGDVRGVFTRCKIACNDLGSRAVHTSESFSARNGRVAYSFRLVDGSSSHGFESNCSKGIVFFNWQTDQPSIQIRGSVTAYQPNLQL